MLATGRRSHGEEDFMGGEKPAFPCCGDLLGSRFHDPSTPAHERIDRDG